MTDLSAKGVGRRRILAAAAAGGLVVAVGIRPASALPARTPVTAWVAIAPDGTVTVRCGATEVGQGIMSGLAQAVAEELMCAWASVVPAASAVSPGYGNPAFGGFQATGGSASMTGYFQEMLVAGAAAREMLVAAAAAAWGIPTSACLAASGIVSDGGSRSLTYGSLAPMAALLPVPSTPVLLSAARGFQIVGKSVARPDIPPKVQGVARFGIDVTVPGMLYGTVVHAPAFGSTLLSAGPLPSGAIAVVPLGSAVGVVASSTWKAFSAAQQLQSQWRPPANLSQLNSATFLAQARTLMGGTAITSESTGNVQTALAGAARKFTFTYFVPYLAHATMEPMNCTASVSGGACTIWAPTQVPATAAAIAAALLGIPQSSVTVHTTLCGGGFGRRLETDYVTQAVLLSKAVGAPVKLTWTREEDFRNDVYRPMALSRIEAGVDASGRIVAWWHRVVSPSIALQKGQAVNGEDAGIVDGAIGLTYRLGTRLVDYVVHPSPVPVGYWRSVGHSYNAFAVESAIDEIAFAVGQDPVAYRLSLLSGDPSGQAVLSAAAKGAGWGSPVPAGQGRGVAFHRCMGSAVAQVLQVGPPSVVGDPTPHVLSAYCVVDCGAAVNPNSVVAQMQGGMVMGLNASLWGQVPISGGAARLSNYNSYRMMRLKEAPAMTVGILTQGSTMGGVGEPGLPPVAPAFANAYFAMTGKRLRSQPFF